MNNLMQALGEFQVKLFNYENYAYNSGNISSYYSSYNYLINNLNMKSHLLIKSKSLAVYLIFVVFCSIASLPAADAQTIAKIPYGNNPEVGRYAKVNGMQMYYEIYGEGKPLVLLHGNGGSIAGQRGRIDYYKKYFKVIAVDSRAHGKSVDTLSKTITYDQMAKDVNDLLASIHVDSAYIWGQSDGGILALLLGIHYPEKTAKIATFGANTIPGKKAIFDEIDQMVKDTLKTTKNAHTRLLFNLLDKEPHITKADLAQIKAPVLLMSGDRDAIRLEHTLSIYDAIPNSNLFIMPGASHFGSYEKTDLFNQVLMDFFTKPFSKVSTVDIFTGKH